MKFKLVTFENTPEYVLRLLEYNIRSEKISKKEIKSHE